MTDVRQVLREGPMTAFQIAVVAVCVGVNMIDGFDVLAAAFVAPAIAKVWAVHPEALGLLLSTGPIGMAIGALFLSPLADVWGRRTVVVLSVAVMGLGMFLSAGAGDLTHLAWLRVLTGLGIGGALASANTVVAEYSSNRRKALTISLMSAGYPVGATIGGLAALPLMQIYDWRAVFVLGGVLSLILLPLMLIFLPESLDFLMTRRSAGALKQANVLMRRLKQPELTELPTAAEPAGEAKRVVGVFDRSLLPGTVLLCTGFFMVMLTFYFLLQWTPKALVDAGLSVQGGVSGGTLMNLGGLVGAVGFGVWTSWVSPRRLAPTVMLVCFAMVCLFALSPVKLSLLLPLGFAVGVLMFGAMTSLYALAPLIYPAHVRATGTGLGLGFGRLGAIVGPIAAGYLIAAGLPRWQYSILLAIPMLLAAVAVMRLPLLGERKG
jgi:benzoate transport